MFPDSRIQFHALKYFIEMLGWLTSATTVEKDLLAKVNNCDYKDHP